MILSEAERSIWYSLSESVWLGATTMLSPVWTPIGSMFSMLQMVMQLSAPSRITSYSISFQPRRERSSSTWRMGEAARPPRTMCSSSSKVWAIPPPVPPSVYAGRTTSRQADLAWRRRAPRRGRSRSRSPAPARRSRRGARGRARGPRRRGSSRSACRGCGRRSGRGRRRRRGRRRG